MVENEMVKNKWSINRRKCPCKARHALLMARWHTDIGKKQKPREWLLKWQGDKERKKNRHNTSGAGFMACVVFFVCAK